MAITTNAICDSFKKELLQGKHDFDTSSDTYKLAMFTSSATLGKSTTNYATANEVSSPSGYSAGGKALVNVGTSLATNTAITDFADLFRLLYDEVDGYGKGHVAECILIIARYELSDSQVVDKEINAMAMLIELLGVIK